MRRIVIEDVCPIHKKAKPHFLWGIKGIPRCPVGSRTVLSDPSEALRVLFPDGPDYEAAARAQYEFHVRLLVEIAKPKLMLLPGWEELDDAEREAKANALRLPIDAAFGLADRKD